jgi:hypothetical protein
MSLKIDPNSSSDDSSDENEIENLLGKLNNHTAVVPHNNPGKVGTKNWYLIALTIGMLVISGSGSFGAVSLLQSYGIISLSNSLPWLVSAIGAIGNTSHFWSLWVISGAGLLIGYGTLVASGYKLRGKLLDEHEYFFYRQELENNRQELESNLRSTLDSLEHLKIDPTQLPILPKAVLPQEDLKYDLSILITWCKRELPKGELRKNFKKMIDTLKKRDYVFLSNQKIELFYAQMELYLKNIIHHLKLHPERKNEVLTELAHAAGKCNPTWLETAKKLFDSFQEYSDGKVLLYTWIQEIKEEIILGYIGKSRSAHWNDLNHWRKYVGDILGLDKNKAAETDPYVINVNDQQQLLDIFDEIFTEKALIDAMQFKLSQIQATQKGENYSLLLHEMLQAEVRKMGFPKEGAAYIVNDHFFDEGTSAINKHGVMLLLKSINFLTLGPTNEAPV